MKNVLSDLSRNVRDRLEYQGRHQVKAMLKNLILKCDFYSAKRSIFKQDISETNDIRVDHEDASLVTNKENSLNASLPLLDWIFAMHLTNDKFSPWKLFANLKSNQDPKTNRQKILIFKNPIKIKNSNLDFQFNDLIKFILVLFHYRHTYR